jgi:predicted transcriptional regulator
MYAQFRCYTWTMKQKDPKAGTTARKTPLKGEHTELKEILTALKKILRDKGLSYRALAKTLGLSESGVKKIFASRDCSYQRLSQIARALGFRITDILNEIDRPSLQHATFNAEQQNYFLKNTSAFRFFVKLVLERRSVPEIQKEFGLSDSAAFRYLKTLDDLHLIRLLPGNQVKLPPVALVRDFGTGPLLEKAYQEWGMSMVQDLADPKFQKSGNFIIRCFMMKDETYQDFLSRLLEVEQEFLRRAIREMNMSVGNLKPMRWMSLTDQESFIKGAL